MEPRIKFGCMIVLTTRCQHRCRHCFVECSPGSGHDMPNPMFEAIVEKAAREGLLNHVTLVGGEPFIDPERLEQAIRRLLEGNGVLDLFIPTNGRWVLRDDHLDIARRLHRYSMFVPHGIQVAFSRNQWNLEQLGAKADAVCSIWEELERKFPGLFATRILTEVDMKSAGRAKRNKLANTGDHVGAHCDYDDWIDPVERLGFLSDYLSFWPDGTVRTCNSGGPILGKFTVDFAGLLEYRAKYLEWLRQGTTGERLLGSLSYKTCENCAELFGEFSQGNVS